MSIKIITLLLMLALLTPSSIVMYLYYRRYGMDDGDIFFEGFYSLFFTISIILFLIFLYGILLKILQS